MKVCNEKVTMSAGRAVPLVIPFTYSKPETTADCMIAFEKAIADGTIASDLSFADVFDYGLNLKVRAKIQSANTETGQKTKNRQSTQYWTQYTEDGGLFKDDLLAKLGDVKGTNKLLDEIYEGNAKEIDAWMESTMKKMQA